MFSGTVIADITTSTSATTTTGDDDRPDHTTAATTTAVTTTDDRRRAAGDDPGRCPGRGRQGRRAHAGCGRQRRPGRVRRPLPIVVDRSRLVLDPRLFSSAYVATAVAKARIAEPRYERQARRRGSRRATSAAGSHSVAKRFSRPAVDATLAFQGERPVIHDGPAGPLARTRSSLTQRVVAALASNSRLPVRVHTVKVAPTVIGRRVRTT